MKNTFYLILVLVVLAVFVFWILPTALHLLAWIALLAGVATVVVCLGRGFWRKKKARLAVGGQAKNERRAHQAAEKSLKAMERILSTTPADKTPR